MLFRGLLRLTWLELKIFLREPLGAAGTILIPVVVFVVLGPHARPANGVRVRRRVCRSAWTCRYSRRLLIVLSAVMSLVTIISIYREGGILKRLRATPLRPYTILSAHVVVKLLLTVVTLALIVLAGKRYYPTNLDVPVVGFALALLLSTLSILSMGFLIASVVPTARFAQPIGAVILYPMVAVSGLFMPLDSLPPALYARRASAADHLCGVASQRHPRERSVGGARR